MAQSVKLMSLNDYAELSQSVRVRTLTESSWYFFISLLYLYIYIYMEAAKGEGWASPFISCAQDTVGL